MNGVTVAILTVLIVFVAVWAWGAHLNRQDTKRKAAARTAEQLQSDYEYRLQQAERTMQEMVPGIIEEAVAYGAYYAAASAGLEPVMPARNAAEAREQRLAARAVRDADRAVAAQVAETRDAWAAMTADLAGQPVTDLTAWDDTPTVPMVGPDWDAVRTADGRVPAALALRYGAMPPPAPAGWPDIYAARNK